MIIRNGFSRRRLLQSLALLPAASLLSSRVLATTAAKEILPMYAMALAPPAGLSKICSAVRQQFDPQHANKTFPHITLKQPFVFADDASIHEEKLLAAMRVICKQHQPFSVHLEQIDMFDSPVHGSVLHVRVALSSQLQALQVSAVQAISEIGGITNGMSPEQEEKIYYPHLTLAQGLSHAAAAEALAANIHGVSHQDFVADTLMIGRCSSDQVWQKIGEIRFGISA